MLKNLRDLKSLKFVKSFWISASSAGDGNPKNCNFKFTRFLKSLKGAEIPGTILFESFELKRIVRDFREIRLLKVEIREAAPSS